MVGWPGAAQDRLPADVPGTRRGRPGAPRRPGEGCRDAGTPAENAVLRRHVGRVRYEPATGCGWPRWHDCSPSAAGLIAHLMNPQVRQCATGFEAVHRELLGSPRPGDGPKPGSQCGDTWKQATSYCDTEFGLF